MRQKKRKLKRKIPKSNNEIFINQSKYNYFRVVREFFQKNGISETNADAFAVLVVLGLIFMTSFCLILYIGTIK